ncbi:hypothetical protein CYMTET_50136 [Cymbomonas tetramitiformis]|uniref:TH1 domain-containing protein n=1 Tax=Cymbomonas tetramitiformis TaxID=36881 RepID=A0AAE0BQE3_9CHLO|nr:hypothetical protein CYMTET_50136 [Cymbomonas tetramitiformis]
MEGSRPFLGSKERRRSSIYKSFSGDHVGLSAESWISSTLAKQGDNTIIFTDRAFKLSRRGALEPRVLLLTDCALYMLDADSFRLRRRIPFKVVERLRMSTLPDNFFAVVVPSEHDLLLTCPHKVEAVTRMQQACERLEQKPLSVDFSTRFEYRAGADLVREVEFTQTEGGDVSTKFYVKRDG